MHNIVTDPPYQRKHLTVCPPWYADENGSCAVTFYSNSEQHTLSIFREGKIIIEYILSVVINNMNKPYIILRY